MHKGHVLTFAALLVALITVCSNHVYAVPYSFSEDLAANPFSGSGGNFSISAAPGLAPDTYGQFTWDGATASKYAGDAVGSLVVVYDSSKTAVRLERALPLTLGMDRNFTLRTFMTIRSQGLVAPQPDIFEMTFALTNHTTTGGNRTGSLTEGADVYSNVEFAYFPHSSYDGPALQVIVFGDELPGTGVTAFSNFASPPFDEGSLGDNDPGQITALPLDTPLDVQMSYDALSQILTLQVSSVDSDGVSTQLLLSDTGVIDIDLSGAEYAAGSNNYDNTAPFSVDALAITSYFDHWAAATPSLYAVVEFDGFTFEASEVVPEPASMMLLGLGVLGLLRRRQA